MMKVTKITARHHSLADEAYARLRALLLAGERYAPGDKIDVLELTQALGVSRSPVWDAIGRLEAEGLLRVVPRHGVFVVRFDPRQLADIFETREALEGMAARLAAERASLTDVDRLERWLAAQRDSLRREDAAGYADAALAFHRALLDIAGNATIERLLEALYAQTLAMCRGLPTQPGDQAARCEDHAQLIAAIRSRDLDRAEAVARVHIRTLALAIGEPHSRHRD